MEVTELGAKVISKLQAVFLFCKKLGLEYPVDANYFYILRKIVTRAFQLCKSKSQVVIRKGV